MEPPTTPIIADALVEEKFSSLSSSSIITINTNLHQPPSYVATPTPENLARR
jgi:hypothetical protein